MDFGAASKYISRIRKKRQRLAGLVLLRSLRDEKQRFRQVCAFTAQTVRKSDGEKAVAHKETLEKLFIDHYLRNCRQPVSWHGSVVNRSVRQRQNLLNKRHAFWAWASHKN